MISFSTWLLQKESSAQTRARSAAARGLMPPQVVGSVHGHSTANPWEAEQLSKHYKKHKNKSKKKVASGHQKAEKK